MLSLCVLSALGDIVQVPELKARVNDFTGTLSAMDVQHLEGKVASFEQTKGSQIVVLIIPTTVVTMNASFAAGGAYAVAQNLAWGLQLLAGGVTATLLVVSTGGFELGRLGALHMAPVQTAASDDLGFGLGDSADELL